MFLTQIINGQVTELSLCEQCARERGLFDPQSLTFAEKFFPEEFKNRVDQIVRELTHEEAQPGDQQVQKTSPDTLTRCPVCHFSLEDYRKTNRLGCPDCYAVFARELETTADFPSPEQASAAAAPESSPALTRARLETELREAVEREDYETAARLRDQMNNLS